MRYSLSAALILIPVVSFSQPTVRIEDDGVDVPDVALVDRRSRRAGPLRTQHLAVHRIDRVAQRMPVDVIQVLVVR